jgi:hypothetical protein
MTANTPPTSQLFNLGQTFFIDPSVCGGATTIGISAVDLFFMFVPAPINNLTGITYPGVSLYITETYNGIPIINANTYSQIARAEYQAIGASSDASLATTFRFQSPIQVPTGATYAFLVSFDQNEQFALWHEEKGFPLVGSLQANGQYIACPGPSSAYCGQYFEYVSTSATNATEPEYNPVTGTIEWDPEPIILDGGAGGTQQGFTWGSLPTFDLKFNVHGALYSINNVPIFSNNQIANGATFTGTGDIELFYDANTGDITIDYPSSNYEFISFNLAKSTRQLFIGAQRIYQNTVPYPGGNSVATCSLNMTNVITANTQTTNGQAFSWNTVFSNYTGPKFVTFIGQNDTINIRLVTSILSNTQIAIDEPVTFVNSAAQFMITPIAFLDSWDQTVNWGTGGEHLYYAFARNSNANNTVRFTSCSVDHTQSAVHAGGTGYANTDVLYITGYEYVAGKVPSFPINGVGNHPAYGNLVTNSTGGVTNIQWANIGAGFVNTAQIQTVVCSGATGNPTSNTSNGSGLSVNVIVGSTVCTELTNNVLLECNVINIDIEVANPNFSLSSPSETEFSLYVKTTYTVQDDPTTSTGFLYRVEPTADEDILPVQMDSLNHFSNSATSIPCYVSYSNQFQVLYANGVINDQVNPLNAFDNSFVFSVITSSISDYVMMSVNTTPYVEYTKYLVNDDYTGENTNTGNALAKHLTTIINFSGNNGLIQMAEDIRVYLTAYQPANTGLECYARIQNSTDPEAFGNEDWTLLELINGNDIFSSPSNLNDYIELTYGFPQYPNVDLLLPGTVTIGNNTSNVVGSNTLFAQTQSDGKPMLIAGDLIKVYDPLFPDQNHAVCMVTNVYSNTIVGVDATFVSNFEFGVGGPALTNVAGLKVARTRNYTHQAFNNIQNDNVVRYYNTSTQKYDGYDILQIKVVFLSNDLHQIPRLNSLRGIGLSS